MLLLLLQVDGDDDEDAGAAEEVDEDEEGFVVGDGYLSDDEGMRDAEDLEQGAAATAGGHTAAQLTME